MFYSENSYIQEIENVFLIKEKLHKTVQSYIKQ
jgi:hypothetical protein